MRSRTSGDARRRRPGTSRARKIPPGTKKNSTRGLPSRNVSRNSLDGLTMAAAGRPGNALLNPRKRRYRLSGARGNRCSRPTGNPGRPGILRTCSGRASGWRMRGRRSRAGSDRRRFRRDRRSRWSSLYRLSLSRQSPIWMMLRSRCTRKNPIPGWRARCPGSLRYRNSPGKRHRNPQILSLRRRPWNGILKRSGAAI